MLYIKAGAYFIAFIAVLGTVGGLELELLTWAEFANQILLCLGFFAFVSFMCGVKIHRD